MNPDLFARIGAALYGQRWQSELARELGVSDRTVRRWVSGAFPIPPNVSVELHLILTRRSAACHELARELA